MRGKYRKIVKCLVKKNNEFILTYKEKMMKGRKTEIGKGCLSLIHRIYIHGEPMNKISSIIGVDPCVLKKLMASSGFTVRNRPNFWKDGGAVCGMCKEFKSCDHYTITNRNGGIYRASGFCISCNKSRRKNYLYEKIKQGAKYGKNDTTNLTNEFKEKMNEASKKYYRDVMDGKYGEEKRNKMITRMYNNSEKRHRLKKTKSIEEINPEVVFNRDKWICYVCGVKTERSREYKPNRATLDHVIALTKGGSHTYDNLKCCCNRCNIKKGNK